MTVPPRLCRLLSTVLALAATGCPARRPEPPEDPGARVLAGPEDRPYHAGTPEQRQAIEALAAQLGTVRGDAFLDLGRRLLAYGERAIPALLGALVASEPLAREHAAYLLGIQKDRRTIPSLAEAARHDPEPRVRYEAAAALLEMRDLRGAQVLVVGLGDPDARLRTKCVEVLAERTGQSLGFVADDPPAERSAAIRRWQSWLDRQPVPVEEPEPAPREEPAESGPNGTYPGPDPARR